AQSGPQLVPFLGAQHFIAWRLTWRHIGYVPDERRRIEAARKQMLAIRRQGERVNFAGMTFETAQLLARRHVPKADGLIFFTARGQQTACGRKGHRDDTAFVPLQASSLLAGRDLPEANTVVGGRGSQCPSIGRKRDGLPARRVLMLVAGAGQDTDESPAVPPPEPDRLVPAGRCQQLAIGRESKAVQHPVVLRRKGEQFLTSVYIPNVDLGAAVAAGGYALGVRREREARQPFAADPELVPPLAGRGVPEQKPSVGGGGRGRGSVWRERGGPTEVQLLRR